MNVYPEAQNPVSLLPVLVGAVLIVIAVWYFKFRKKKPAPAA